MDIVNSSEHQNNDMINSWRNYIRNYKRYLFWFKILLISVIISQPIFICLYCITDRIDVLDILIIIHISELSVVGLYISVWGVYDGGYIRKHAIPCPRCGFLSDAKAKLDSGVIWVKVDTEHIEKSIAAKQCICRIAQK